MSVDKVAGVARGAAGQQPAERATSVVPHPNPRIAEAQPPQNAATLVTPQIEDIAKRLDSYIRSVSRSLEFKVDAASGRTIISVLDAQTGDLIRQIPNEEVLRFAQMAEEQTIVLLNETV